MNPWQPRRTISVQMEQNPLCGGSTRPRHSRIITHVPLKELHLLCTLHSIYISTGMLPILNDHFCKNNEWNFSLRRMVEMLNIFEWAFQFLTSNTGIIDVSFLFTKDIDCSRYNQVHKSWDIKTILIFLALYTSEMDLTWHKQVMLKLFKGIHIKIRWKMWE